MTQVTRLFREFLVIITVLLIPFLLGRGIFRLVAVAYPDLHVDRSEDAASGAGMLLAIVALLAYLVTRGIQFFQRRGGEPAGTAQTSAGVASALMTLLGLFLLGAIVDGFSVSLMSAQRDAHDVTPVSVPEIPPPIPDAPPAPQ